ncbi:MAG: inositol monophosphatase family protein [Planctomycetota bacterium]
MNGWEQAEALARGAGEILDSYYGRIHRADARQKQGVRADLVSDADVAAERYLVEHIPDTDDVLGEEGDDRQTGAARHWIVDPLDGTVNFLHGIPFWAVSVALVENGELTAGVVHAPALGLTFCAARGEGCHCNGEPVSVSASAELEDSILATGFAYRRGELADHNFDNFEALGMRAAGVRRMGAAAVDLAFIASGRIDGFWELHLNPWDVAAGILLIREAGGRVTDFAGSEELDRLLHGRNLVATNGHIHETVRAGLNPLRGF